MMKMMKINKSAFFASCALLFASVTTPAMAQSLFSTHGLGVSVEGVDARARGIGVSGVGLLGLSTTMLNPAEQAGTLRRGVAATMQPWGAAASINGEKGTIGSTRFPLMQVLYPYDRITFSLGYAGVYDQSWAIISEGTAQLGSETVSTRDVVKSVGGINEVRIGGGYYVNQKLSLGAAFGFHTGGVDRTVNRTFPDSGSTFLGYSTRERWSYTGPLASVGFRVDPTSSSRIGGSITWRGKLKAKPDSAGSGLSEYSYDMPLRFALGASSRLGKQMLIAGSATISNFGSGDYTAPGMTQETVAQSSSDYGIGLEYEGLRTESRIFPARVGFRYSKLPFHNANESAPREMAGSVGLGLRLAQDDYGPLAVMDFGFEKGKRDGWTSSLSSAGLTENFWRLTASISLFGR